MFNEINILRNMPIFENIEVDKLEKIFNILHLVKIKKDTVLITTATLEYLNFELL
jgi:hypothetical protein